MESDFGFEFTDSGSDFQNAILDGSLDSVIFFYFASVIVFTATLVVAARNPIYSALALLVMFFHVAGLYITLHAEFLAAIQISSAQIWYFSLFREFIGIKAELTTGSG